MDSLTLEMQTFATYEIEHSEKKLARRRREEAKQVLLSRNSRIY